MTEAVWIAVIGCVGVVTTAICGVLVAKVTKQNKSIAAVKDHVANSHLLANGQPYNLRDNIDDNQAQILNAISRVEANVNGVQRQVGRVETRLDSTIAKVDRHLEWSAEWSRGQERADRELADGLGELADTLNVKKENPHG